MSQFLKTLAILGSIFISISICGICLAQNPQEQPKQTNSTSGEAAKTNKVDEAKRADIMKMLELTGAGKLGLQAVEQMIGMQRQANPSVPSEFWDEFLAEIDVEELLQLSLPSYEKHFTHDEIKELIKFYESPVGKKMIAVQPQVMQESMVAGQKWGMDIARKITERLKSGGY
jgi:hypothetical protein